MKTAACVYPETHCPWPGRWLWCGKLNVAFGNEQQLCHLHTLIHGSTGGIIICQTCLHNEELSREISWRSVAINVQVLPRQAFLFSPHLLLPPHVHPLVGNVKSRQEPLGTALLEGARVPCSRRVFRPPDTPRVQPCLLSPRGYAIDLLSPRAGTWGGQDFCLAYSLLVDSYHLSQPFLAGRVWKGIGPHGGEKGWDYGKRLNKMQRL